MNITSDITRYTRPITSDDFIGDTQVKLAKLLENLVATNNISNKILISGSSGIGKTSLAYMYASLLLNIKYTDPQFNNAIRLINCTVNNGVDFVRDNIVKPTSYRSMGFKYQVWILEEFHGLTKAAQESLLITVESLVDSNIFIATTTSKEKITPALLSRFKVYELLPPSFDEFKLKQDYLIEEAVKEQKIKVKQYSPTVLNEIIYKANDNVRTFDMLMEQLIEGYYVSSNNETSDKEDLKLLKLINKKYTLQEAIELIAKESSYEALTVGLCNYAIKILTNKNSNKDLAELAKKVVLVFGDGLNKNVPSNISFIKLLIKYYKE